MSARAMTPRERLPDDGFGEAPAAGPVAGLSPGERAGGR
jgi:hypothetical protein